MHCDGESEFPHLSVRVPVAQDDGEFKAATPALPFPAAG
jgi:hypothetical protein